MDITSMVNKLNSDYYKLGTTTNSILKYKISYNGYSIDVFYSNNLPLKNTIRLVVDIDDKKYLITEHYSKNGIVYEMNTYVDPEIYDLLKFTLFYVDGKCKTTPFFESIVNQIIDNNPICSTFPRTTYIHKNSTYHPYFETTVRKKMSDKMRERIRNNYIPELANKILEYCGDTLTLRFTSDETRAKNIDIYFDNY